MIIAGLIGEAATIVFVPSGGVEKTLSVIFTLVIALGVWLEEVGAEVIETSEKSSNELKLAELTAGAAEAELETERLRYENLNIRKHLAPRSLSKEQFDEIQTLKGKATEFILAIEDNLECFTFAGLLVMAFQKAEIKLVTYILPPSFKLTVGIMLHDQHAFSNPGGKPTGGNPLASVLKMVNEDPITILNFFPSGLPFPPDKPAIFVVGKESAPWISPPYCGP
jgi:hypothetical protein